MERTFVLLCCAAALALFATALPPDHTPEESPVEEAQGHIHTQDLDPDRRAARGQANREYDAEWKRHQESLFGLEVESGAAVGEVGCGDGFLALTLARAVGPSGQVYANEIEKEKVDALTARLREEGLENVTPVLGTSEDTRFPSHSLDLVVMVEVFHHLDQPREVLASARRALKPGARLVIIEPDADQKDGRHEEGCYSDPALTLELAESLGFRPSDWMRFTVVDLEFFVLVLRATNGSST